MTAVTVAAIVAERRTMAELAEQAAETPANDAMRRALAHSARRVGRIIRRHRRRALAAEMAEMGGAE
jgi:hypothetical protein